MEIGPVTNNEAIELRELVRSSSSRRASKQFLIEGPHLVERALEAQPRMMRQVYATEVARETHYDLIGALRQKGITTRPISQKNAERISDTETTQGIFALVDYPQPSKAHNDRLVLVLDDLQDPGNVGTIIRTAAWFGVHRILATTSTADCYSPKVIRATQGAIFFAAIEYSPDLSKSLLQLKKEGFRIVGASLSSKSTKLEEFIVPEHTALILGSEAHGISPDLEKMCDSSLRIEKIGEGESLNVAVSCGILLQHFASGSR